MPTEKMEALSNLIESIVQEMHLTSHSTGNPSWVSADMAQGRKVSYNSVGGNIVPETCREPAVLILLWL